MLHDIASQNYKHWQKENKGEAERERESRQWNDSMGIPRWCR
ncbi:hypothetical protein [Candidatus Endomicrobiellum trichonymphae]